MIFPTRFPDNAGRPRRCGGRAWRRTRWAFFALAALGSLPMAIRPAGAGEILAGPYPATVLEVVDGDTLRVRVEVWIGQSLEVLARIRGIDAPELRARCDAERAMALAARAALAAAVPEGAVTLVAVEGDKYFGRVVADVSTPAGIDLAALMRTNGHARPYDGEARAGWCADAAVAAGPAAP